MKVQTIISSVAAALAVFYLGSVAQASQPVTIAISTVGNAGNAADPSTGYGSVGYTFGIGTYDVTLTQYTAFLNAVAQTDTYGLYNSNLDGRDSKIGGCIAQSGVSGSYTYSAMGDGQRPVTYVSWFDAARFTNWLSNGQPVTHVEDATTTETGAYTLNGDLTNGMEAKSANAQWWIPSEDEWYKAAYYDPNQGGLGVGGYWSYATRSNTVPGNSWANRTLANEANYLNGGFTLSGPYLTDVGAFTNSASAYGTYDQAGNVWNWSDASISGSHRGLRGGSWNDDSGGLRSSYRGDDIPTNENYLIGFRVATVPEPSSIMLIGLGGILLAALRSKPF